MIEDFERLLCILEEKSLTRASQKLHITQPGLSYSLKRLESALKMRLFRHDGKKLLLTKSGENAVVVIKRIVYLYRSLLKKNALTQKEAFTVGMYDNAALLLAKIPQAYEDMYAMDLIIDNSETLFMQLVNGILDLCICVVNPNKSIHSPVTILGTYEEKLIPVSSKKWRMPIDKIPFLLYNEESITRKYIDAAFVKHNIFPTITTESTSPIFLKELAMMGSGVALLPENFVKHELQTKKLQKIMLPFSWERVIGIYGNKESGLSKSHPLVQAIFSCLRIPLV